MPRLMPSLLALAVMVPIAGCGEVPVAPADPAESPPITAGLSVADGPSQPGASPLFRVEIAGRVWFAFWSPDPLPTVVVYQTDDSFNLFGTDCQTATVTAEPVDVQRIAQPSGALAQLLQAPEVLVSVYDARAFAGPPPLTCAFLLGEHRLADGTGRIVTVDTDRTTIAPGTRAISWAGTGQLTLVDNGSALTLNHQIHMQVNAGDGTLKALVGEIRLSPDPR